MKRQLALVSDLQSLDSSENEPDQQSVSLRNLAILVCTAERFADQVGLPIGVVQGHIKKGYIPVKRIGKYTLINLALFNQELLNNESFGG